MAQNASKAVSPERIRQKDQAGDGQGQTRQTAGGLQHQHHQHDDSHQLNGGKRRNERKSVLQHLVFYHDIAHRKHCGCDQYPVCQAASSVAFFAFEVEAAES